MLITANGELIGKIIFKFYNQAWSQSSVGALCGEVFFVVLPACRGVLAVALPLCFGLPTNQNGGI
ncbi:hypothetical protein SD70_20775 [Gordoniibacillus kamchatkensis]|uniref:Uncharacterized protein n=1 Tax=Gordoniibacillus kamchatkensis TaxID=1590651 RepID=A0ABR5AE82_9BACL|nr:hypothetical protein SD70_20775 [Paenibacillus sp. VKM B-2647]